MPHTEPWRRLLDAPDLSARQAITVPERTRRQRCGHRRPVTPFRKPAGGELLDWQEEFNTEVNKIRWMIEQVISHFKN